ncbi:uncharacterized protein [Parasteatoda tepidariorum]|uniref:uncharacterized protein n=1 Tax=Parasteatoda tepidariorum TaxID=114398 RepID=UPI0039BD70D7
MSPVPQSKKNYNVTENQPHILRSHKVLEKEKSAIECMPPVPQSKKNDEGKVTEGQSISLPQPARNENEESMSIDSSSNSGSDLVVVFESPRKSRNTSPKKDNDAAIKQPHILRSHKTPENEKPIVESKLTIQSDKGSDLVVGFESPKKDNDAAIKQPHILRSHKTPENEKPIVENKLAIQSDKGSDVEVLYESPRKQSNTQPLKETLSKKVGKQKQSSPEKQSPPWEVGNIFNFYLCELLNFAFLLACKHSQV